MKKRIIFLFATLLVCTTITFGQATVTKPTLPSKQSSTTTSTTQQQSTPSKQRPSQQTQSSSSSQQSQIGSVTGTINGHEYVDLGRDVKWATCNLGASSPTDYGYYFAWGETSTKSKYIDENSETYKKYIGDIAGYSKYDAACAMWGGSWRMPTKNEVNDIIFNCKWKWTEINGCYGYQVTGFNGNSIFLPAAGCRYGTELNQKGSAGGYWISTPEQDNTENSWYIYFNSENVNVSTFQRFLGQCIRPVSE